jgi:hypothetical protein
MRGGFPFRLILLLGCLSLASTGWAKEKTAAVPFLTLDVSARSAGMGGAQAAVVDDATAITANPAALRRLLRPTVSMFHASYIGSSFFDFVGFGRRVGRAGAFGVGAQFLSQGSIERIDEEGNTTGNFAPNDAALSFGYAGDLGGAHFGVGGKFIRSTLVDTASSFAFDAGFLSPSWVDDRLRLAAVVSNFGPEIKYTSKSESLPTEARAGVVFEANPRWDLAGDYILPVAGNSFAAVGVEYHVPLEGPLAVNLRGGYNTQSKEMDSLSGFSGGIGFGHNNFDVDYALVTLGDLGLSHRFSLTFRFGPETKPPVPKKFPRQLPPN